MAASRSSLETVLSKPGGGEAPILMTGGVPEMMMASKPNEIQLHLSQRKGFVKMAMEVGSTLVPCFVFGETETYNQSGPLAQIWNRLTCSVRNCFGIAPVFFSGILSCGNFVYPLNFQEQGGHREALAFFREGGS